MANKNHNMKLCSFYLTNNQYDFCRNYADKLGLPYAEIIRRALDNFIKTENIKRDKNAS